MYFKEDYKQFLNNISSKYSYIILDPPWNYDDKPPAVTRNQLTYNLWENTELKEIFNTSNINHIFLWSTNNMLPLCFDAAKNTEFEFKTLVTWVKSTHKDNLFYGLGNTFRNCTEQLLVFSRKGVTPLRLPLRTAILAESGDRTGKPKAFERDLIEHLTQKGLKGIYIYFQEEI